MIHPTAQTGWSGRGAEDYEAGRPGYPRAAVEWIGAELGVGHAGPNAILDLAAGTGKLTRELGVLGAEVIAVEPVAAMRAQLTAAAPGVRVLDGTAEAIPLGDGAVHAVLVAQAFHWFDVPAAAAEIRRMIALAESVRASRGFRLISIRPELSVTFWPSTPMNEDRLATSGSFRTIPAIRCWRSAMAA